MSNRGKKQGRGIVSTITTGIFHFSSAVHKGVHSILGHEGLVVVSPDGGQEDGEVEATRGRWNCEDKESYWKMMHRYVGSDITSLVTLPVFIFEPMTMLQKLAEVLEYAYLLDLADDCEDPYVKLVYATTWALSSFHAYSRTWKPFNPILGETYELAGPDGTMFLAEQVSHHPPMCAAHSENTHWAYDCTSKVRTKFLGNSLKVYPVGRFRVRLKKSGEVLDLASPITKVHNLIFGRTWTDTVGDLTMTNLTTGDRAVIHFQACGWFGAGRHDVDGHVYNSKNEPKLIVSGNWSTAISYQACTPAGKPLPNTALKEVWRLAEPPTNDRFQYTHFAHKINSFETAPKGLLTSDSRLRPDRHALEFANLSKAGAEKSRMEDRQRTEKRQRDAKREEFTPRWFKLKEEINPSTWGEHELYEYNGKYKELHGLHDKPGESPTMQSMEFNPWQFGGISDELGHHIAQVAPDPNDSPGSMPEPPTSQVGWRKKLWKSGSIKKQPEAIRPART